MEPLEEAAFYKWAAVGVERGWVTPSFCFTHEGDPFMSLEEESEWDDGGDPCMVVMKVIIWNNEPNTESPND